MLKMANGKEINKAINHKCNFARVSLYVGNNGDVEKMKKRIYDYTGEYPNDIQDISKYGNGDVLTFWTGEQENITQWFCTKCNWPALIEDPEGLFDECDKLQHESFLECIHINGEITSTDDYIDLDNGGYTTRTTRIENTISGIRITKSKKEVE